MQTLVVQTGLEVHSLGLVAVLDGSEFILQTEGHLAEIVDDGRGHTEHLVHVVEAVAAEPESCRNTCNTVKRFLRAEILHISGKEDTLKLLSVNKAEPAR